MQKYVLLFFVFSFSISLILEGLGIPHGRNISLIILIGSSILTGIPLLFTNRHQIIHNTISTSILLFILFCTVSVIISRDIVNSFPILLLYMACFIGFYYSYFNKELVSQYVIKILFIFSGISSIYLLMITFVRSEYWIMILSRNGYQLTYPFYYPHNHLGDFLAAILIFLVYQSIYNKRLWLPFILFVPFYLFSFSRSGYMAFILPTFFMLIMALKDKTLPIYKGFVISSTLIMVISATFFFSVSSDIRIAPFNKINSLLTSVFEYNNKTFTARRIQFVEVGLDSIIHKPLFGIGPNNYILVSRESGLRPFTDSSHNILVDIFVENGILAGGVFILFIIIHISKAEKNIFFYMFLSLLINFQTDYTFKIYCFLFLFFIFAGLSYKDEKDIGTFEPVNT